MTVLSFVRVWQLKDVTHGIMFRPYAGSDKAKIITVLRHMITFRT